MDLVTHPSYLPRLAHLLDFDGRILYRVYTTDPYEVVEERFL